MHGHSYQTTHPRTCTVTQGNQIAVDFADLFFKSGSISFIQSGASAQRSPAAQQAAAPVEGEDANERLRRRHGAEWDMLADVEVEWTKLRLRRQQRLAVLLAQQQRQEVMADAEAELGLDYSEDGPLGGGARPRW